MKSRSCLNYVSPPAVCADDTAAILFKSASIEGNKLYTCTSTEVLVYELPSFRLVHYISLPCFNDLHHVCPSTEGTLLVVATGLDMVVEVTTDGRVVREWSVLGGDPWQRFSRDIDYRRVLTTKPHQSHPNHVFQLGEEVWVTRLLQRDAICLTRPDRRIDIAVQRPHDGLVRGDSIYFTTVDGHVVIASQKTLQVERVIDLNTMSNSPEQVQGWCRGLLVLDERQLWVGFTRVRPTKLRENLAWIKNGISRRKLTHIALYDLDRKSCLEEIPLEPHGLGVVFSLFSVPANLEELGGQTPVSEAAVR
jgi:hypothetical protein